MIYPVYSMKTHSVNLLVYVFVMQPFEERVHPRVYMLSGCNIVYKITTCTLFIIAE